MGVAQRLRELGMAQAKRKRILGQTDGIRPDQASLIANA